MKKGDWLIPVRAGVERCLITDDPSPPELWEVKYVSGRRKKWSKSHLRKYYFVADNPDQK